jgi:hypothetical protein
MALVDANGNQTAGTENNRNWRKKFVRQYVAPLAPGALDKNDHETVAPIFGASFCANIFSNCAGRTR